VDPGCSQKTLNAAYRNLAKKYHPDHPETADITKFDDVIGAYRVLRSAKQREDYDNLYHAHLFPNGLDEPSDDAGANDNHSALSDAEAHMRMLNFLYRARRDSASEAGVGRFYVQQMLNCSDNSFDFHIWYLKAKGFIETTEQGTLAITIDGVDHVIATSRATVAEKLLISQLRPAG
jgi:curved DNA-binding protein